MPHFCGANLFSSEEMSEEKRKCPETRTCNHFREYKEETKKCLVLFGLRLLFFFLDMPLQMKKNTRSSQLNSCYLYMCQRKNLRPDRPLIYCFIACSTAVACFDLRGFSTTVRGQFGGSVFVLCAIQVGECSKKQKESPPQILAVSQQNTQAATDELCVAHVMQLSRGGSTHTSSTFGHNKSKQVTRRFKAHL